MSWLERARLKAFAFFAVSAGGLGYLSFHNFDHGHPVWGVVCAVGADLALYLVVGGFIAWRRGALPEFDSPDDVRQYLNS